MIYEEQTSLNISAISNPLKPGTTRRSELCSTISFTMLIAQQDCGDRPFTNVRSFLIYKIVVIAPSQPPFGVFWYTRLLISFILISSTQFLLVFNMICGWMGTQLLKVKKSTSFFPNWAYPRLSLSQLILNLIKNPHVLNLL